MKWLILAIFAEVSVLLCLIYAFDGALHSWSSARLTWDHAAVAGRLRVRCGLNSPDDESQSSEWRV